MSPKRRSLEITLAVLFAGALLAVGGAAIYFIATINPVHPDPAAIPSNAADVDPGPYASAFEKGRVAARELLTTENLPGLSIAVASNGAIVWAEGFGFANIEKRLPVTPRTRFRTGSVSKTMTATAVALLHERGRLDLDAPVQTYVPAYPEKQWTVTPRQLLGDIAGVHRIRGDQGDFPRGECQNLDQALRIFSTEPLLFEPGTQYKFSTYGWILLSAVVEGASKEPFPVFMRREVFTPLGMDRTVIEGTDKDPDDVSFYFPRAAMNNRLGLQDAPGAEYGCFFGAGGYVSTPSDLARIGSAMTVRLKADTTRATRGLLKPATIALFQTPLTLKSGESTGFALGWKVDDIQLGGRSVRVVRHRAGLIGGRVSLSVFPDLDLVVAAMSNVSHYIVDPFALQVAEAFARP